MSLSTYYLEYGSHLARLHSRRRRRRLRRVYAPSSNTASHDNHEKINSWVSFCFPYEYGAPLGGPSGRRSSAIIGNLLFLSNQDFFTCVHPHLLQLFLCICELEDLVFILYGEEKLMSYFPLFAICLAN